MATEDGRGTCQSPTWQPADYTSHTIAIGIARGHGDTVVVISREKERKKRMSNLERERVRDNANKSGLCSTSPPSLTESAHSWHAARTQAGAGEILNVAERGSSQSSNFNVALCMPYSRSLSL